MQDENQVLIWHCPTSLGAFVILGNATITFIMYFRLSICPYTVRSESHSALRLRYVDLVVSIEVAVEVCCCFTVFSC
jgi:hypothetical protein